MYSTVKYIHVHLCSDRAVHFVFQSCTPCDFGPTLESSNRIIQISSAVLIYDSVLEPYLFPQTNLIFSPNYFSVKIPCCPLTTDSTSALTLLQSLHLFLISCLCMTGPTYRTPTRLAAVPIFRSLAPHYQHAPVFNLPAVPGLLT